METTDVVIVGAGFTGSTLAEALADGQRKIVVLEARAGRNPRFAGELLHPTGVGVLDSLGLLSPLRAVGGRRVRGFCVLRDARDEPLRLPYDEVPGGRPDGLAIEHQAMVDELRREAIARPGVEVRCGRHVTDLVRDGGRVVGVRTDDGREQRASLVLGAEGRHSRLRGLLGIAPRQRLVSMNAAVLARDAELPAPGFGHVFLGAWGPILAYEIAPGEVRMCLDLPVGEERGAPAVIARLRREHAPFVPEPLRGALLRALDEGAIDLAACHAISTDRCTAPGIALVGDANGCAHPLTAAGMTLCLNDVRLLRDGLGGLDLGDRGSVDAALARYQDERRRFARAREILTDALYDVLRATDDGTRAIRRGLFRYWTSGPRARGASIALLSCAESRPRAFVEEYLRVVAAATGGVLRGEVNAPSLAGRAGAMLAMGRRAIREIARATARRATVQSAASRSSTISSATALANEAPASAIAMP